MPAPKFDILVVEDDTDIRETVAEFINLTFPACRVLEAADGHAALKALSMLDRLPCLILLDLMMPGLNGNDLLKFMRADDKLSTIPVVIMTASSTTPPGVAAYLRKPFSLESLCGLVREHCAHTDTG